eukprot:766271-Hanusia_phi.AAC.6
MDFGPRRKVGDFNTRVGGDGVPGEGRESEGRVDQCGVRNSKGPNFVGTLVYKGGGVGYSGSGWVEVGVGAARARDSSEVVEAAMAGGAAESGKHSQRSEENMAEENASQPQDELKPNEQHEAVDMEGPVKAKQTSQTTEAGKARPAETQAEGQTAVKQVQQAVAKYVESEPEDNPTEQNKTDRPVAADKEGQRVAENPDQMGKDTPADQAAGQSQEDDTMEEKSESLAKGRGRGRPSKDPSKPAGRGRGRPPKDKSKSAEGDKQDAEGPSKATAEGAEKASEECNQDDTTTGNKRKPEETNSGEERPVKHQKCEHGKQRARCKECSGGSVCEHGSKKSECKECKKKKLCPHGKPKPRCKECGGSELCVHGRQKSGCRDCGGGSICIHRKQRSRCKECGGGSICEHDRNRSQCKICGVNSRCEHGRRKSQCKECGGGSICLHGRRRSRCKDCGGGSICVHGIQRSGCKPCGGGGICKHAKQKSRCVECGGGSICAHGKRRTQCRVCGGGSICEHNKQRSRCRECGGGGVCPHGKQKSACRDCGGGGLCVHGRQKSRCKECGGVGICIHNRQRGGCRDCRGSSLCVHLRQKSRCKECPPRPQLANKRQGAASNASQQALSGEDGSFQAIAVELQNLSSLAGNELLPRTGEDWGPSSSGISDQLTRTSELIAFTNTANSERLARAAQTIASVDVEGNTTSRAVGVATAVNNGPTRLSEDIPVQAEGKDRLARAAELMTCASLADKTAAPKTMSSDTEAKRLDA